MSYLQLGDPDGSLKIFKRNFINGIVVPSGEMQALFAQKTTLIKE
jgi:hypothetical protein